MEVVSINPGDYRLTYAHLQHLATEYFGRELAPSGFDELLDFGFEDQAGGLTAKSAALEFRRIIDGFKRPGTSHST